VLTGVGGIRGRLESRWRRKVMVTGSGQHGGGVPEVARRREQAGYARLVLAELRALSSSPGGAPLWRIDGSQHGRRRRRSARLQHKRRGASRSDRRLGHAAHGGSLKKGRRRDLSWGPRERKARRRSKLELGLMSSSGTTEGRL
jgi:hypothetical protein